MDCNPQAVGVRTDWRQGTNQDGGGWRCVLEDGRDWDEQRARHEQGLGDWGEFEKFEGRRGIWLGRSEGLGKGKAGDASGKETLEGISARLFKAIPQASLLQPSILREKGPGC